MYCTPKKNVVYERYLFYNRKQKEGEQFEQFLTHIKKLAQNCEFGDLQDQMVRDRVVMGINDTVVQERLLRVENLDLKKTVDHCGAAEISQAQIKTLYEERKVEIVNKIWVQKSLCSMLSSPRS